MSNFQLLVSDPLFLHHRSSGLLNLREIFVVDVIKGDQFGSFVVFVGAYMLVHEILWVNAPKVIYKVTS